MRTYSPADIAQVFAGLIGPHLVDPNAPAFYLWAREDRAIISVNPGNLRSMRAVLSDQFRHDLSTMLSGARVVRTNTLGIFYQVAYTATPPASLSWQPLDFSAQPSPLHLPIGMTAKGPLWLPLGEIGSALIGGTRRMGKTRLVHAWIQALIAGGEAEVVLYDGKQGLEFSRYLSEPRVTYAADLLPQLERLQEMANQRAESFRKVHATSLAEFNRSMPASEQLPPVVLFIDEAATLPADTVDALARLVAWGGAHGIHPVIATQRTGSEEIPPAIKTNLSTRICFPVPAVQDSMVVLGRSGAEKLPKTPGRMCFVWGGQLVTAQAYRTELPGMPALSGRDIDLAHWAIERHNGRVSIPLLVREQGMKEWEARELLDLWQSHGWLEGGGQGVARRVSPSLERLIPQSLKAPQSSQSVSIETAYGDGHTEGA